MRPSTWLGSTTAFLAAALVVQACSSSDAGNDTGLGSVGGSSGGNAARGGSSGTTGGSPGGGSGGSAANGGAAASGGSAGSTTGGSGGSTGGSGGSGGSVASGEACPGLPLDDADAGAGVDACRGVSFEAEPVPVDLYLMMDRSVSLKNVDATTGLTRWQVLRDAIAAFVDEASAEDVRVGLGFFGRTGGNDDALDCDANYYAVPKVEIGDLANVGNDILDAMDAVKPGGLTPTAPALEGALAHASEWAAGADGRATAVVLVTDGYPTQCAPMALADIAAMAEAAHTTEPYVRTYVIGLAADFNLDSIAIGGGTHQAYLVDEGDPTGSFVAALRNVSNTKLACRYEIPPPPDETMKIDYDEVQVTYTAGDTSVEEVPRIYDLEACARNPNGGWYYDNPDAPTQILVCPCTCSRFEAGRVDVAVGCKPRVGIR